MRDHAPRRGFTLIELVIVIGLIALLAATIVLVLDPAAIFREGRDIRRIADLGKMNAAVGLAFATSGSKPPVGVCVPASPASPPSGPTPSGDPQGSPPLPPGASPPPFNPPPPIYPAWCYQHAPYPESRCEDRYAVPVSATSTASRKIDGTGWVPIDMTEAIGGTLLSAWPVDPGEDGVHFYSFICRTTSASEIVWEFSGHMESVRYASSGESDVESTDGGNRPGLFETGTDVGL